MKSCQQTSHTSSGSNPMARIGLLSMVVLALVGLSPDVAEAQGGAVDWSEPVVLFEHPMMDNPVLISDRHGLVNLLWPSRWSPGTSPDERPVVLYCAQWNDGWWSIPRDVLVSPRGGDIRYPEGAVDPDGRVHVVWLGPNSELYYSQAPSFDACNPQAWTTHGVISHVRCLQGDIAIDSRNVIHVVYSERAGDVYYISSDDSGISWSSAAKVSIMPQADAASFQPQVAAGPGQRIHVVWEVGTLPSGVPAIGIFYAQSADGGVTWSDSVQIGGPDYGDIGVLVADGGTVHLAWNGRAGFSGRYHQWSSDGGSSWSPSIEVMPKNLGAGQTGRPGLALDSAGSLHLVSGMNVGQGSFTAHARWDGRQWTPPQFVSGNLDVPIEQARIAVTRGNQLHVAFKIEGGLGYVRGQANAPGVTPVPYPTATTSPTPKSTAPATRSIGSGEAAPSPNLPLAQSTEHAGGLRSMEPILFAVTPVVLLLGAAIVVSIFRGDIRRP